MTPPNVIFVPAPVATVEVIGTCTAGPHHRLTGSALQSAGWQVHTAPARSNMFLRNDAFGAFIRFDNARPQHRHGSASNSARDVEIVHDSGSYYWDNATGGGMSIFATVYVRLNLSGWSGTLPGAI